MSKFSKLSLIVLFALLAAFYTSLTLASPALRNDIAKTSRTGNVYLEGEIVSGNGERVIEVGDVVNIAVKGYEEDYNKTASVDQAGKITYGSFGKIQAAGLTTSQLADDIKEKLQIYISDPQVEISVWQGKNVIRPGDVLSISVAGYEYYSKTVVVHPDGMITYMPLGEIQAADLTTSKLEENIEAKLSRYITDPQVGISLAEKEAIPEEITAKLEPKMKQRKDMLVPSGAVPEKKEYLITPGDVMSIVVAEHAEYSRMTVVQPDGNILYPPLGQIPAAGLTSEKLSQRISTRLSSFINNPQVSSAVNGRVEFGELEQYFIKPGDSISIVVPEHDIYSQKAMVMPDGNISYKPLGQIPAAGLTEEQLAKTIDEALSEQVADPRTQAVVLGKVDRHIISTGDVISIAVEGRDNYNQMVVVQPNGRILYSPLGEMQAAGLQNSELTDSVTLGLSSRISNPQVTIGIRKLRKIPEEVQRFAVDAPVPLRKFGYDYFSGARNRILRLEESFLEADGGVSQQSVVKDAISGFVGPMDMMDSNVAATVPSRYVLGPGDELTIHFWGDLLEFQTLQFVVDNKGEIVVPKVGKMVVRGMTLAQFQEAVKEDLTRMAYKDLKLIATLDKLRSIQIFITGEAFRPGSYAVSAVTTLFNALYMCGGPTEDGSLRNIKLLRNKETQNVDLYKFLMEGDSSQDFDINAGDTIFIPRIGRTVTVSGEVKRPAVYELSEGENLQELVNLAGGVRPSGFLQRIQIDSVDPSRQRIVLDVDLSGPDQPNPEIFDGDSVTAFSIPSERMNTVTLEGKVRMPGIYQLKEGMKVSDLIAAAMGLLGEAYAERADLLRLNPDRRTTKLIPINLSMALAGDSDNDIMLEQWDKLVVYSKWDVKWTAERAVNVHGAVQNPGSYERSDGMKVADLLLQAGGTLPDAYLDRVLLLRLDERGEMTRSIPLNLKDAGNAVELEDGDALLVYSYQEARWEPAREATIEGPVQNPNTFARTDGMKVSDLIQRAGGLLPEAYPDRALLLRMDERRQVTQGFSISPKLAMQDDPANNLELKDGDRLRIFAYEEAVWETMKNVSITGSVQNPDVFERFDGMRVSDLLHRAGGPLPNAYLERADIKRFRPDHETYLTVPVNIGKALSGDAEADILLEDEDMLTVYTLRDAQYKPENIVTIYGAVQRPDVYTRTIGMKLSDLLFAAGGLLPSFHRDIEITRIDDDGRTYIQTVDALGAVTGDESQDFPLNDEDVVSVRKRKDYLESLRTVTIKGEVRYPGNYALKHREKLSALIERAGGMTDRAYPDASVITRKVDYLALDEQKRSVQQVKKLLEGLSEQEYQRELARALLIRGSKESKDGESASSTSIPTTYLPVSGTVEEITEAGAIASIPGQAGAAVSAIGEIVQPQYTLVTEARKVDSFLPSGRVVVNLGKAMENPGEKDDIILEDGDVIEIPPTPAIVSVSGAVIQPSSLVYTEGKRADYYIAMTGGYSRDADIEAVYIIKANGMVVKKGKEKLQPGDMIVVPTKVMVQKITDRWGQVIGAIKFTVTTLAMVYTVKLILDR